MNALGPNLVDVLAAEWEQAEIVAHYEREARKAVWPRRIRAFCLAVAVFCIVYFGLQLLRVAL
jgi:hypothetical protein